jgi:predicted TIM-barrel enzyme
VITGAATGRPADPDEVRRVAEAVTLPVLVGSGVTADNLQDFTDADAFIVGSSVKRGGLWSNAIDPDRCAALAEAFARLP